MKTKVKHTITSAFLVFISFILLISCMEGLIGSDIDTEMETNPTLSMPLAYGTFDLGMAPLPIDTIAQDILDSLDWVPDSLIDLIDTDTIEPYSFTLSDTSDLDLSESFDQIEEATIYLTFRNRFPFDSEYNVILYDSENDLNVDTFVNIFLPASEVVDGEIQEEESQDSIVMDSNFNDMLEASDQIIVNLEYTVYIENFADNISLSDYSMWFKIGMKAKVEY